MSTVPCVSQAEWVVMQVLWRKAPLSATEVFEEMTGACDWHPKTVRTLLGRLVQKGALRREKRGGVYRFEPRVTHEQCVREEARSFLQRFFGGSLQPMLAHLMENEELSTDEIEALRAKLDELADRENTP